MSTGWLASREIQALRYAVGMSEETRGARPVVSRPWVLILVALSAVGVGYGARRIVAPASHPASADVSAEAGGEALLEFDLVSLAGSHITAADYAGRVMVVDFWASWCGPCRLQAEILHKLREDYRADAVSFVAINVGEPEELVRQFVEDEPFSYPVLMDPTQSVSSRYEVYALPTVMVIGPDSVIDYSRIGVSTADQVAAAIDRALGS